MAFAARRHSAMAQTANLAAPGIPCSEQPVVIGHESGGGHGIICNACLIYICCVNSIYDSYQSTKFMLLLLFLDEGNAFMRHKFGENLLMH